MRIVTVTERHDLRGHITNGIKASRALARLGHRVTALNNGGVTPRGVAGADLVLAFGTIFSNGRARSASINHLARLAAVKSPTSILALWYFDMCCPRTRHSPWKFHLISASAKIVDWLFTTDHSYPWEATAKNYRWLTQGVDSAEFVVPPPPPEPRRLDVIFTGGTHAPFDYRQEYINALKSKFKVGVYGRRHRKSVFGSHFVDAYGQSRLALVPPPPPEASHHYWSNRLYLAAATGTPCLVGYAAGLEDHYEDGREVAYFRNTAELMAKAQELLKDPAKRKAMGDAARARTLTEHTYEMRCRALLDTIFPPGTTQ